MHAVLRSLSLYFCKRNDTVFQKRDQTAHERTGWRKEDAFVITSKHEEELRASRC